MATFELPPRRLARPPKSLARRASKLAGPGTSPAHSLRSRVGRTTLTGTPSTATTVRDVLRERAIARDLGPEAVDALARDMVIRHTPEWSGLRLRRWRGLPVPTLRRPVCADCAGVWPCAHVRWAERRTTATTTKTGGRMPRRHSGARAAGSSAATTNPPLAPSTNKNLIRDGRGRKEEVSPPGRMTLAEVTPGNPLMRGR
ncbi:hypothetical protein F4554_003615 [Actinopolymorpha rutila]|uniref:Uncharacterized protein n=1 Tax=Actinopolymorpha rutila TaxID=446787 RepID=A0A852ZCV9_9ACTN|nr:hypothetical protein [Actinopolymorpha rutila]